MFIGEDKISSSSGSDLEESPTLKAYTVKLSTTPLKPHSKANPTEMGGSMNFTGLKSLSNTMTKINPK